jgi:hypothetical protein
MSERRPAGTTRAAFKIQTFRPDPDRAHGNPRRAAGSL